MNANRSTHKVDSTNFHGHAKPATKGNNKRRVDDEDNYVESSAVGQQPKKPRTETSSKSNNIPINKDQAVSGTILELMKSGAQVARVSTKKMEV